jgi:hypothetical protein
VVVEGTAAELGMSTVFLLEGVMSNR